jgi:predicted phage tail protein
VSISGSSFTVDGEGTLPATIAANSSANLNVHFGPANTGSATGQLVITTNSLANSSITIQLSGTGVAAQGAALTVNASSIAFGNVALNTPATQPVTLQSTGSAPVTVSSATVTGTGFTLSGGTFPLTLNPSQSATLSVQFNPTVAGGATGTLTITSNSSTNPTVNIGLSGTGQTASAAYQVDLNWAAPTGSSTTITGYNIYRSQSGSSSYQILNSGTDSQTAYIDSGIQSGSTYQYYVTSVDSIGAESVPSNVATVAVP